MQEAAEQYRAMSVALNHFYADALYALGEHARSPKATAQGAAKVLKRVAQEYGIEAAETMPLPRLTRQELDPSDRRR
jgi:hypothetical protein